MQITVFHEIKSANTWLHKNWRVYWRYKDNWCSALDLVKDTKGLGIPKNRKFTKIRIVSFRHKLLDWDNLVAGVKPINDWLTRNKFIVDDNSKEVTMSVLQKKIDKNSKAKTTIYLN